MKRRRQIISTVLLVLGIGFAQVSMGWAQDDDDELAAGKDRAKQIVEQGFSQMNTVKNQINTAVSSESDRSVKSCLQNVLTEVTNTMNQLGGQASMLSTVESCGDQDCIMSLLQGVETAHDLIASKREDARKCAGEGVKFGSEEEKTVTVDPNLLGEDPQFPYFGDIFDPTGSTAGGAADDAGDNSENLNGSITDGPGSDTVDDIDPEDSTPIGSGDT